MIVFGLLFFLGGGFFQSGDFFMDIVFPSVAGAVVFALILNSLANHFGYRLF